MEPQSQSIKDQWIAIIADRPHGIDRIPIGEGKFGLGKTGDELCIARIFKTLRKIESQAGIDLRIIAPYAHGLEVKTPLAGKRDLFFRLTVPCFAGWYQQKAEFDRTGQAELEKAAGSYGAILLPHDQEEFLTAWCRAYLRRHDNIILVSSIQAALNVHATVAMISRFRENDLSVLCAKGHGAGLTPVLYSRMAWMRTLTTHRQPAPFPLPDNQMNVHPELELLEQKKVRIVISSGYDVRNSLLLRRFPDLNMQMPDQILRSYVKLGKQGEFKSRSGKSYTVIYHDRIQYYGNGGRYAPITFDQTRAMFQKSMDLLRHVSGSGCEGLNVLEIGAGDCNRSLMFKYFGAHTVVATDFEIGMGMPEQRALLAQWPQQHETEVKYDLTGTYPRIQAPGLYFAESSGEHLPFPEACFDLVFSDQVLEHVRDPLKCMQEMVRVLRPGGTVMMRYNAYFHLVGGHGECTTDVPWAHVLMTPEEMEEYFEWSEFRERGIHARKSLDNYFNPERLHLTRFEEYLEQLAPIQLLHYHPAIQTRHTERITKDLLNQARERYPELTIRDLITSQVAVIFKKLDS